MVDLRKYNANDLSISQANNLFDNCGGMSYFNNPYKATETHKGNDGEYKIQDGNEVYGSRDVIKWCLEAVKTTTTTSSSASSNFNKGSKTQMNLGSVTKEGQGLKRACTIGYNIPSSSNSITTFGEPMDIVEEGQAVERTNQKKKRKVGKPAK